MSKEKDKIIKVSVVDKQGNKTPFLSNEIRTNFHTTKEGALAELNALREKAISLSGDTNTTDDSTS